MGEMIGEVFMSVDDNDDIAIDRAECDALSEESEEYAEMCHDIVDVCDMDGDGAMDGCELLACIKKHGKDTGCKAECPCDKDSDKEYCQFLNYCKAMKEEEEEMLV